MKKTILIIANLDTRGKEFNFVRELIQSRGYDVILLDFSMEQEPFFEGDITCEEVARAGGIDDIEEVHRLYRTEREKATTNQINGAIKIVRKLLEDHKIHGVLGVGGGTSSFVSTSIMKTLPFGMPKLMASSMAGHPRYAGKYVGTKDITMLNTVVDVVEINPILKTQLINAVGAICGMVEIAPGWHIEMDEPVIAMTSFGFAERAVEPSIHYLREKGYIPVPCHAQGRGDRAMDELIREGWFQGVIDFVTRGIGEQLLDGNCAAGEDRVLAAAETGIPQVVAPSGLDMLSVGGRKELLEQYRDRPRARIDSLRLEIRTQPVELEPIATILAERLNASLAPCAVLNPKGGWSSLDEPGRALYDPEADAFFMERLKSLLKPEVRWKDVDYPLNSPEFGAAAVDLFDQLYHQWKGAD